MGKALKGSLSMVANMIADFRRCAVVGPWTRCFFSWELECTHFYVVAVVCFSAVLQLRSRRRRSLFQKAGMPFVGDLHKAGNCGAIK